MKTSKKTSRKRTAQRRPDFLSRSEVQRNQLAFLGAIERAIDFHRTNPNDPHNVGAAVVAALTEVRDAFKAYYTC